VDTKNLEQVAESLIAHKLQQAGMLVAKPKFDVKGTDLLAFVEMGDGVKFCRIQCKGRSLIRSPSSIIVPASYVTKGFIVVLYVDTGPKQNLYCFFESDVQQWRATKSREYRLSLSPSNVEVKLEFYRLDETKIGLIEKMIRRAEVSGEFQSLVYGRASTAFGFQLKAYGTVTPPPKGTA
jgi:hypothetical protein